jgi:hypothetical protein
MSNPPEERLREMKAAFREAARQEIAQTPAPAARWRWSGRTVAGVIAGIAATGGLATATVRPDQRQRAAGAGVCAIS